MTETLPQRPADELMRSGNLAAMQPSALSGTRALIDKMTRERWQIVLTESRIDIEGAGTMVYTIRAPKQVFTFIAYSFAPQKKGRTGRIIGRAWDMMCALVEGEASPQDIAETARELPKLYRGRATPQTLVWGRSNRSMRVFTAVLEALKAGKQPEIDDIANVCYLMRNTGLDGNGTFGTRSYAALGLDHALGGMLEAQLLSAYMMREMSCDLVSQMAALAAPDTAVPLAKAYREYLGVGNGSALGLIFFVQKHPKLINSWITARETAIARARMLPAAQVDWSALDQLLAQAITFRSQDRMYYESFTSSAQVAEDLARIKAGLEAAKAANHLAPLDILATKAKAASSPEAYETLLSIILEQILEVAAELWAGISGKDEMLIHPQETVADLMEEISRDYGWALQVDMQTAQAISYVWYKSETAEEPRRGLRDEIPEARDLGLDLPGDIQRLMLDLGDAPSGQELALFLLAKPMHRFTISRIHTLRGLRYHTPHANIHDGEFIPIDLVRLMNVGIHGIVKTKDFLQRNLRGLLFHGAPSPDVIASGQRSHWFFPAEPHP